MKLLKFNDSTERPLPFYLAMEEHAASIVGDDDLFFLWQVSPTVIFGRNQVIDNEVDLDYCRSHGIAFYRRKSGGGCVYADRSNIMFSYITRADNVTTTFSRYTAMIVDMLNSLGLNASDSARNDILIDGLKVSGNAFYHLPGRSIVHGTMLYDTDLTHLTRAITPGRSKLAAKGVKSVASRVTTLNRYLTMSIDEFKRYAISYLTDGSITLTQADLEAISAIVPSYLRHEFIYGHRSPGTIVRSKRFDGVGEIEAQLVIEGGIIHDINLTGDFFVIGDLDALILNRLRGVTFTRPDVAHALTDAQPDNAIMNLSLDILLDLLFN